ncbi:MAG: tRNA adenosine(34) deaminase TadA [Enterocloster sp.]
MNKEFENLPKKEEGPECRDPSREPVLTQQQKGEITRRKRWLARQEKRRLEEQKKAEETAARRKADEKFMREALRQAGKAAALGDVPIGCVIVKEGKIIARGYNRRNADKSVLSHAEILAIRKACKQEGDWRLEGCTMYITLEPCPMCAGAIVQARIPRVVIGCMNPKAGCAGSVLDMLHEPGFNHQVQVEAGVLKEECSGIMTRFFHELRMQKERTP